MGSGTLSSFDESTITPGFLSNEEQALYADALLGREAVEFLNSDLGRLLRGYAVQRREEAKEALANVPAWRKRKIQTLQFQAAVAGQFLSFVQEAVMSGKMAEQMITQMRAYK